MNIQAYIGLEAPDKTIRVIQCQQGCGLLKTGLILINNYQTPEQVEQLIRLGNLSKLDPKPDNCITYRCTDDTGPQIAKYDQLREFNLDKLHHTDLEYLYLFRLSQAGHWRWYAKAWRPSEYNYEVRRQLNTGLKRGQWKSVSAAIKKMQQQIIKIKRDDARREAANSDAYRWLVNKFRTHNVDAKVIASDENGYRVRTSDNGLGTLQQPTQIHLDIAGNITGLEFDAVDHPDSLFTSPEQIDQAIAALQHYRDVWKNW